MEKKETIVKIEDLEDFPGEFVTGFVRAALEGGESDMGTLGEQVHNQLSYCYGLEVEVID